MATMLRDALRHARAWLILAGRHALTHAKQRKRLWVEYVLIGLVVGLTAHLIDARRERASLFDRTGENRTANTRQDNELKALRVDVNSDHTAIEGMDRRVGALEHAQSAIRSAPTNHQAAKP